MKKILMSTLMLLLLLPASVYAQELGRYLIMMDIGDYRYRQRQANEVFGNSGTLIAAGHFDLDHDDITYETRYLQPANMLGVDIQVTQHSGSDSDKWLLHELENGYRDNDPERLGLLEKGVYQEKVSNNTVLRLEISGGSYRWISNNVIVYIRYEDPDFSKPEPLEVVQSYLAKFPSTIPATFSLNKAHNIQWLKDEMDRRLWLSDKWYATIQSSDPKLKDKLKSMTDSMVVFLDYREKYFGVASKDEKIALATALSQGNVAAVQAKLTEYKTWWAAHKTDSISL